MAWHNIKPAWLKSTVTWFFYADKSYTQDEILGDSVSEMYVNRQTDF